jgi:4-amino-4-deoxy-L-arabinose transferase-like glycosyltransferase
MSAEVGGRLETIEPHRSLFGPDYLRLAVLLAAAFGIHAWLVAHTAVPARDSLGYARIALNLSNPAPSANGQPRHRIDVIRTAEQPPGYPIAIWMTEKALRAVVDLPLAERSLLAAQLANAAAAVLLVIPIYLMGRILFSRNVGFAAALMFEVLPIPARMTSDGLSEGVYLFVVATAILLCVRSVRHPTIGRFILSGVAVGLSYLVRPEGLGVAMATTAVIIWAGVIRMWQRDHALGYLTALVVGVALVGLPYMLLIGKLTNKPTGSHILNPFKQEPGRMWLLQPQDARGPNVAAGPVLFAKWWDPILDAGRNRELWALEAVWSESIKSSHYIMVLLALFALFAHRKQLASPDLGMWLLIVLIALNLSLMFYLADRIWYVSERHTLQFVMLCCVLAAGALKPLAELICSQPVFGRLVLWPDAAPAGLLTAIVASALPFTFTNMHAQREGHKHAGQWLAEHMGPDDWLIDPLAWAEWYSGRTLYETTAYRGNPAVEWVVVEREGRSPHSRIPQWEYANAEKQKGKLVYQWPENPRPKDCVVCVYRVEREEARPRAKLDVPPAPANAATGAGERP